MGADSKIEWTERVWNPLAGCAIVSPGCTNCYAMKQAHRFSGANGHPKYAGTTRLTKAGPVWTGRINLDEQALALPLRTRRPTTWFVNSMSDLFAEGVSIDTIDRIMAVMALCPQHIFQVLTKRSERMRTYLCGDWWGRISLSDTNIPHPAGAARFRDLHDLTPPPGGALPNLWAGVSVEDQPRADQRIPDLLATPAAVRFLSLEPLLGLVNLNSIKAPRDPDEPVDELNIDWRFDCLTVGDHYWFDGDNGQPGDSGDGPYREHRIDWVIAGGESGPGARPIHPDWVRAIRDQCAQATLHGDEAPVPFFFKQWGEWLPAQGKDGFEAGASVAVKSSWTTERLGDGLFAVRVGKKAAGRVLDGRTWDQFPKAGAA